jgi:hypothetical protein
MQYIINKYCCGGKKQRFVYTKIIALNVNLIFMDPCIVNDSVEITTRCRFVIEFIIIKFIEGSTCFKQQNAHHQEL